MCHFEVKKTLYSHTESGDCEVEGCTVSTFGNREKTLAFEFLITRSFPDANWLLQLISRNLKTKGLGNYLNDKKMRCEIIDFI